MKALILNSGLGSRMGVLTSEHPKCMTEISPRETILSRQLRQISEAGYDLQYGARPLRRAIQRMVEDALSEEILLGHIKLGDRVVAAAAEGELRFTRVEPDEAAVPEAVQPNMD